MIRNNCFIIYIFKIENTSQEKIIISVADMAWFMNATLVGTKSKVKYI